MNTTDLHHSQSSFRVFPFHIANLRFMYTHAVTTTGDPSLGKKMKHYSLSYELVMRV